MANDNPFSMVYSALFDMMSDRTDFQQLVKLGNRIRFDSETDRDPLKDSIQAADLPEVSLLSTGTTDISLYNTSNTSMIVKQYGWYIATGDYRYAEFLCPVEWAVFTGMLDWQTKVTALQWCNQSFVKRADFLDVENGFTDVDLNRGIRGWSAIWNCEIEMHFVTKDLRDGCP